MRIRIYTNILNDLIDRKEISVPDDLTLKQLFEFLVERYGAAVRNRIFESDAITILNGRRIDLTDANQLEAKLREDDSLSIISAAVGG